VVIFRVIKYGIKNIIYLTKTKQSHERPGQAQRVPDFKTIGI